MVDSSTSDEFIVHFVTGIAFAIIDIRKQLPAKGSEIVTTCGTIVGIDPTVEIEIIKYRCLCGGSKLPQDGEQVIDINIAI